MPYDFFYICDYKSTNSWLGKKDYSLEWPANLDKHLDRHYISVSWMSMKLGPNMYFVNKQLTYFIDYSLFFQASCLLIYSHKCKQKETIKIFEVPNLAQSLSTNNRTRYMCIGIYVYYINWIDK